MRGYCRFDKIKTDLVQPQTGWLKPTKTSPLPFVRCCWEAPFVASRRWEPRAGGLCWFFFIRREWLHTTKKKKNLKKPLQAHRSFVNEAVRASGCVRSCFGKRSRRRGGNFPCFFRKLAYARGEQLIRDPSGEECCVLRHNARDIGGRKTFDLAT